MEFKLTSKYTPSGDQPQAIEELTKGLLEGKQAQTLLGVTGSGKSIGYCDPLYVEEYRDGAFVPRVITAGPFIDSLMKQKGLHSSGTGETEQWTCSDRTYYTQAYDPSQGVFKRYPVAAFLRHRAPADMFRLTTSCGRAVTLTGDHNLWVLREGTLQLTRTRDVCESDYLPVPNALAGSENLQSLYILPYLSGTQLSVFAEAPILQYLSAGGHGKLVAGLKGSVIHPYGKLFAIRKGIRGSGLKIPHFLKLMASTNELAGMCVGADIRIGRNKATGRLSMDLPLSDAVLSFFGYYVAEGNSQRGYLIIANRHPVLRSRIEQGLQNLGVLFSVRANSDYQASSYALTRLMTATCGSSAARKKLPDFWPRLSNRSLGILLKAYFDGDGTVERNGEVTATTASVGLASDLCYALKRFGIHARLREVRKRAMNSKHAGGTYFTIVISGREEVNRYASCIGFDHPEKHERLHRFLQRSDNTNVDVVPIGPKSLRTLRESIGISQLSLAGLVGCSRSAFSMIESGKRRPSRKFLLRILEAIAGRCREQMTTNPSCRDQWNHLRNLCEMRWTPISQLRRIEYSHPYVYDLSVPGPETFLAGRGGLIVHNTYTMANVIQNIGKPTLVMSPNKTLAAQLYGEFRDFFPENAVHYFVSYYDYYQPEAYIPQRDLYIEKDAAINEDLDRLRLAATSALMSRRDVVVVSSVSCIYNLGSPEEYRNKMIPLRPGLEADRDEILEQLVKLQYQRNEFEFVRGTFRAKGDVLEIFPSYEETAVRVELEDEKIRRLEEVHPVSGEILRPLKEFTIYPAKHFMLPEDILETAVRNILQELEGRVDEFRKQGKLLEAQRLEARTRYDVELLQEIGYCPGIENYSRHLSGRPPGSRPTTLIDYFPEDFLMVVDESHVAIPQIRGMFNGDHARKTTLVEHGFRLPSALENRPLRFEEWESLVRQGIYVSATPGPYELEKSGGEVVEQIIRPTGLVDPVVEVHSTEGQIDHLLSQIDERVAGGDRVLVTTLTKRMAEDLAQFILERGHKCNYLHSEIDTIERVEILAGLRKGRFDCVVGVNLLREGLDLPEVSLVAILDADKEGFLRSATSLIQTIGRSARNVRAKVLLYADKMTPAIREAIGETNRRREIQLAYNREHGITPQSIVKEIRETIETERKHREIARLSVRESEETYFTDERVYELEQEMMKAAEGLEFEKAAEIRDRILELKPNWKGGTLQAAPPPPRKPRRDRKRKR